METAKTFLIVDDHPLIRDGLSVTLKTRFRNCVVRQMSTLAEVVGHTHQGESYDAILLDLKLSDSAGFDSLRTVKRHFADSPVVIISGFFNRQLSLEAKQIGAAGYLSKTAPRKMIVAAVEAILSGQSYFYDATSHESEFPGDEGVFLSRCENLTPQQRRVLQLVGEGLLNKQIAHKLDITEMTVKAHVSAILEKLDVRTRTQAVAIANKVGFVGISSNSI